MDDINNMIKKAGTMNVLRGIFSFSVKIFIGFLLGGLLLSGSGSSKKVQPVVEKQDISSCLKVIDIDNVAFGNVSAFFEQIRSGASSGNTLLLLSSLSSATSRLTDDMEKIKPERDANVLACQSLR